MPPLTRGASGPNHGRVGGLGLRRVRRLVGLGRAGAAEGGVRVVDARVDDRDLDVLAGVAGVLPHLGQPQERHGDGVVDGVGAHGVHRDDAGQRRDGVDLVDGHRGLEAVVGRLHLGLDLAALAGDRPPDGVLRLLELALDFAALTRGELATLLCLDDGDGVAGHLDHDRHASVRADRRGAERGVHGAVGGGRRESGCWVVVRTGRECGAGGQEQRDGADCGQDASLQRRNRLSCRGAAASGCDTAVWRLCKP